MNVSDNHHNLQESLYNEFLRRSRNRINYGMVFQEIALAGSWGSQGRLDVVVATSTQGYRRVIIRGYEVKASRADLLSDLRSDKWRKYLKVCTSFYFAFPVGIIKAMDEIPKEAGIMMWNGKAWYTARKARDLGDNPERDTVMRMLWRLHRDNLEKERSQATTIHSLEWDREQLKKRIRNKGTMVEEGKSDGTTRPSRP